MRLLRPHLALLLLAGCATESPVQEAAMRPPEPPAPSAPPPPSAGEVGIASWYGRNHHGRQTASGEAFDMNAMTAAHRTLPFGTRVRVTNLENGRSTEVRITDRGPRVRGRLIDLSAAAARAIGLQEDGIAQVRLELVRPGQGA